MATQADLLSVLRKLHRSGISTVTASQVAELLWPNGRTHNSNGQVFPLNAGAAGRMLRACPGVVETSNRVWTIVEHRIE